jgi:hypothetical protein
LKIFGRKLQVFVVSAAAGMDGPLSSVLPELEDCVWELASSYIAGSARGEKDEDCAD